MVVTDSIVLLLMMMTYDDVDVSDDMTAGSESVCDVTDDKEVDDDEGGVLLLVMTKLFLIITELFSEFTNALHIYLKAIDCIIFS